MTIASTSLDNSARTADRLLLLLKTRGPLTAAELAGRLAVTAEAARQQLLRLQTDGLVEAGALAGGAGRPAQTWRLTPAGEARFPDTHAELTVQLLDGIRTALGEEALDRLITVREEQTRAAYAPQLAASPGWQARVQRLAELRAAEGYMAECHADGDSLLLLENHCPICAAATACQGFCRSELELFADLLGPEVTVTREDHILAGARRCAYRIAPAQ